jgi:hypothetical protein
MTNDAKQAIERLGGASRVATEAGVSAMTVRRAMAGQPVHRKTMAKIHEAIERLGESVHPSELSNVSDGTIYHISIGLTCYRIRVRLASNVRYRADVHYQMRHGSTSWTPVGRVEAATKADLVNAAKLAAKKRIEETRLALVADASRRMGGRA